MNQLFSPARLASQPAFAVAIADLPYNHKLSSHEWKYFTCNCTALFLIPN